ncbi:winged helix-turn-helix domain-containing protein [Pantoea sp. M_9]|uniref:winged helix-turn-helix domain-containing protein n=1 Tax=Pantoea sp. M_9 TaxID=2608041 RepID=UPI001231DCBB|nr:winged helix-turn-helix domain-containing protein [Pantoea sp. M_9]KAA5971619.1 hypothetical protein F3I15_05550 [Pantoea sp. M_9]
MSDTEYVNFNRADNSISTSRGRTVLSETAARCLALLSEHEKHVVTKEEILSVCWQSKGLIVSDASVRQLITQLRRSFQKIGMPENIIITVPRQGYMLQASTVKMSAFHSAVPTTADHASGQKPGRHRVPVHYVLLCALFASLMLCTVLWYGPFSDAMTPLNYVSYPGPEGIKLFVQQPYLPAQDEADQVLAAAIKAGLSPETHTYVYLNHTDLSENSSAFLCAAPLDSPVSRCTALLINRGDHGY